MGRFRKTSSDDGMGESIDISPLIDVVFILLIFFIVTATFVETPDVDVEKPLAIAADQLDKNSILIAVTDTGEVVYGGREIGVAGVQAVVKRILLEEEIPVIVQADRGSDAGVVVRVIDEAKLAGAQRIHLASLSS